MAASTAGQVRAPPPPAPVTRPPPSIKQPAAPLPWDSPLHPISPWILPPVSVPEPLQYILYGWAAFLVFIVIGKHLDRLFSVLVRVWGQVFTGPLPALDKGSLKGKTCVVTGSNIGVGKATVQHFIDCGASRVVLACRSTQKANQAKATLVNPNATVLDVVALDLASLASVRAFPARLVKLGISTVDVLVNNAGVMMIPGQTVDGHEMQFGTNHLGHFELTKALLPMMPSSPSTRIVVVASVMHHASELTYYTIDDANQIAMGRLTMGYNNSKLANILFAKELARRLHAASHHARVYIADPGTVHTTITKNINGGIHALWQKIGHMFVRLPREGAWTSAWLATAKDIDLGSGAYYVNCRPGVVSVAADDIHLAARLWDLSEDWTGSNFVVE